MSKRIITAKLTRRGDTDQFDREFWRNAGHEARFVAAAEMVIETELFRGKHACEFRLQRDVLRIQRRKR